MSYHYTDSAGQVAGPVSLNELKALLNSGGIPPDAQVCAEGSEAWHPITSILGFSGAKSRLQTPIKSQNRPSKVPLILSFIAIIIAVATAAKVFWPDRSIDSYSFKNPEDALTSFMAINRYASWNQYRALIRKTETAGGKWPLYSLERKNVQIHKTLEVKDSGSKNNNGIIICFLSLKCSDGVTRYDTIAFEKNRQGDFMESYYPGYISDETSEDKRLHNLIETWKHTGEFK